MLIKRPRQRSKFTLADLATVQAMAQQVVLATEQTFTMSEARKKAIALDVLEGLLLERGLRVSRDALDAAIEASVRWFNILENPS